jgi:phospholipid N-methyltransferase
MTPQQPSLFGEVEVEADWDSDSWETPDWLAQKMANLVLPTDRRILEPAAGTGQIAKYLPQSRDVFVLCNELKTSRFSRLSSSLYHHFVQGDFLSWDSQKCDRFDLTITNPPFSLAIEFIEQGLQCLNPNYEHARLLYLLPVDFCQTIANYRVLNKLDCHIHHEYRIVGRVPYLQNGKPVSGRQVNDCVFDIRPGRQNSTVTLWR